MRAAFPCRVELSASSHVEEERERESKPWFLRSLASLFPVALGNGMSCLALRPMYVHAASAEHTRRALRLGTTTGVER